MTDTRSNEVYLTRDKNNPTCASRVLRQRRDFLFVQHRGARHVTAHFILQAAVQPPSVVAKLTSCHRTGVTASKKVGNAVARNKAKRRMRAMFRHLEPSQAPFGTDYVLVARHSLVQAAWSELSADFFTAAKRIHKKLNEAGIQE